MRDQQLSERLDRADSAATAADRQATAIDRAAVAADRAATLGYRDGAQTAAASVLAHLNDFKGRWYGSAASDPSVDPLGNAPDEGDVFYNTTDNRLRVYESGAWVDLGSNPGAHDVIHIKDYGGVGDGSTDDTVALLAWLAAINASTAENVTAVLGSGKYRLASGTATNGLVIARNNVTIDGTGASITLTGTGVIPAVFQTECRNNITYRNIRFYGNCQADAFANGAAIWYVNYLGTSCSGLLVEHCYFENFKGDYWVFVENVGTRAIADVVVRNNFAVSKVGNARGPATITISSSFCGVFGSGDLGYLLTEVLIENNVVYADYIKSGVNLFNNVQNFTIQNNTIWNAGQQGISNDCGSYAILIYANAPYTPGRYGRTTGNKIFSPRSIGIYQANTWAGSIINDNLIVSQGPDTLNVTLPKGGIVLNGSYETTVTNNTIFGTTMDAIWCNTSPVANTCLNISNNTIRGAGSGIVFESATYNGNNIVVQDNLIQDVGTKGIICRSYTGVSTSDITVRNNQIWLSVASSVGIELDSPTSTYQLFYCNIQGNCCCPRMIGHDQGWA